MPNIPNILGPIVGPLTKLLMLLTGVLHSYGLAIIIFTILVRAALAPLNLRQLRSAKKMSALAPKPQTLLVSIAAHNRPGNPRLESVPSTKRPEMVRVAGNRVALV